MHFSWWLKVLLPTANRNSKDEEQQTRQAQSFTGFCNPGSTTGGNAAGTQEKAKCSIPVYTVTLKARKCCELGPRAGSASRPFDPWLAGCEFEPHSGHRAYFENSPVIKGKVFLIQTQQYFKANKCSLKGLSFRIFLLPQTTYYPCLFIHTVVEDTGPGSRIFRPPKSLSISNPVQRGSHTSCVSTPSYGTPNENALRLIRLRSLKSHLHLLWELSFEWKIQAVVRGAVKKLVWSQADSSLIKHIIFKGQFCQVTVEFGNKWPKSGWGNFLSLRSW